MLQPAVKFPQESASPKPATVSFLKLTFFRIYVQQCKIFFVKGYSGHSASVQ